MKLANIFERKFLFGVGRHFWNIVGVSGFIALLTGIILFVEGSILENAKSKERFIGKDKLITSEKISNVTAEMLSYEEWKDQKGKDKQQLLSFDEWIKENEYGVKWNDSKLSINWPIPVTRLSNRDKNLPYLK